MIFYSVDYVMKEFFKDIALIDKLDILDIIDYNIRAFKFNKSELRNLNVYIISRKNGNQIVFKTIRNVIVEDMLDIGYSRSKECLLLDEWNLSKVYKISFISENELNIDIISYNELNEILINSIKPKNIKYVLVGQLNRDLLYKVKATKELTEDLTFDCLKDSFAVVFNNLVKNRGLESQDFKAVIVDFE